eukprot:jgi/Botrbrau1/2118/Bobra.0093s0025.1
MCVAVEARHLRHRDHKTSLPDVPSVASEPSPAQSMDVNPGTQSWLPIWAQRLLRFSPLSFSDEALEGAFAETQRSQGSSLGVLHFAALSSLTVLSLFITKSSRSEEWIVTCAFVGLSLLATIFLYEYPDVASKHIQAINGLVRISTMILGIYRQPALMRPRPDKPLSALIFVQTYALHTLVIATAFVKLGAWQAFLPNLATSVLMVFIQASANHKYCKALGHASTLDVIPLAVLPSALDVLAAAAFTPGLTPPNLKAQPTCAKNIAALQLVGSFLTDVSLLVWEAVQRRTFLLKNNARLGPGGAGLAASWPLGDVRGAQRCALVALSYLPALCFIWQILLISVV